MAVHQSLKYNDHQAYLKKLEHGKELKTELQSNNEGRRKDLSLRIDCPLPSKHLVFYSHQIHHNTQCSIALHKSIFQSLLKGRCQAENKSMTLYGTTHRRPNKAHTIDHNSKAMGQ